MSEQQHSDTATQRRRGRHNARGFFVAPSLRRFVALVMALPALGACSQSVSVLVLPVDTRLAFTNVSKRFYAVLAIRAHSDGGAPGAFTSSPLLAPGAAFRVNFADVVGSGCPEALDLRIFLYKRIHEDEPIGLDPGEPVDPTPIVAGEVQNIPACSVEPVETYTILNWDADEGIARVKIAQDTSIEATIRSEGIFPNPDAAWEVVGVDPALAAVPPPALAPMNRIAGRVTLRNGTGVGGVGVLLRSRFRVRLDDGNPQNDPDAGFSDPIDYTITDDSGAFALNRPAGVYQVEFFSDNYAFRPAAVEVETPLSEITIIVEPL